MNVIFEPLITSFKKIAFIENIFEIKKNQKLWLDKEDAQTFPCLNRGNDDKKVQRLGHASVEELIGLLFSGDLAAKRTALGAICTSLLSKPHQNELGHVRMKKDAIPHSGFDNPGAQRRRQSLSQNQGETRLSLKHSS